MIAAICVLVATEAKAASKSQTKSTSSSKSAPAQERAAHKACLDGDYTRGVSILSDLFLDTHDATYIFNQGRCFEQNHRYEDAIARFEEYLRTSSQQSKLDEAGKNVAEKHIADCRGRLGPTPTGVTESAPAPTQPVLTVAPPQPPLTQPPPAGDVHARAAVLPSASSGSALRVAGIVTASVGVAGIIGGIVFNAKVNSMATDMETTPGAYSAGKESDRKTYETLGWVSYGVGAACVATGAILYLVGLRSGHDNVSSVSLLPTAGAGHAGAILQGAF